MRLIQTTASCPSCCISSWLVGPPLYQVLNPTATCAITGNLFPTSECVTGTPLDAVRAGVTGSLSVVCKNPLFNAQNRPFPNPCRSKTIPWFSIATVWDFLVASGRVSVQIQGVCGAVVSVDVEDCPEFGPAARRADLRVTFVLTKCTPGCINQQG